MKTITPTVGRIVYFDPGRREMPAHFSPAADDQPLAAIIAAVFGGGSLLALSVIDSGGQQHPIGPVQLVQEGESIPDDGCYAYWMPYQLAQAGVKPLEDKPLAPFAGVDKATLATAAALPTNPAPGTAPKVEPLRIDALVASLTYETAHVPGTTSTVATARLPGGFVVSIGHSACVAPQNFDAELGRKYAIEDAERQARGKLWSFEGYALYLRLEQLRAAGVDERMPAHQQRVLLERLELDERITKLNAFITASTAFQQLPEEEQADLKRQLRTMLDLADVLTSRINRFPKVQA